MTDRRDDRVAPDAIDSGAAPRGLNTATGVEAAERSGELEEARKDAPQGSEVPIEGGEPEPDFLATSTSNKGNQKEPAEFVINGTINPTFVPSPSGSVPASAEHSTVEAANAASEAAAEARVEERKTTFAERNEIPDDLLSTMSAAEIRAVATDRGYTDVSDIQGRKSARSAFKTAQGKDKSIKKAEKPEK